METNIFGFEGTITSYLYDDVGLMHDLPTKCEALSGCKFLRKVQYLMSRGGAVGSSSGS